nr:glycosyl transferase [Acidovorax sp.]
FMNRRSRWSGIATGDQALFMTRAALDQVDGFPPQALMEDIEISKRLLQLSRPACLAARVVTSGRRWETRGVWRTIVLMWRLRFAYWWGASPQRLAELYR